MRRFLQVAVVLLLSGFARAQNLDASLVLGTSFISETNGTFAVPEFPFFDASFTADHHLFVEGTFGARLLNAHVASLHLELPVAAIPSQQLSVAPTNIAGGSSIQVTQFNTLFITPALRVKLLPGDAISPWASIGGGWGRYNFSFGQVENKAALQYGGGVDFKTGLPLLAVRAEVRDFVTSDPDFGFPSSIFSGSSGMHHHNLLAGGGIVLRF